MNTDRFCQILFIILLLVAVTGCGAKEDISQAQSTNTVQPTQTVTLTPTATQRFVPSTETSLLATPALTMTGKDGMTLLYIPAGEFTMGSDNGAADEKPVHKVTLDAFWIDRTEVTNAMYSKCVDAGVCILPSNTKSYTRNSYYDDSEFDDYPVIYVDWNMAKTYCEWAGRRLPTEAEWEKAARGTDANIYPWGDTFDGSLVNFCDTNCSFSHANKSFDDGFADTSPVGNYPNGASPYGALDMAGNVWEWVEDWYDAYPGNTASNSDYGTKWRVLRGGTWYFYDVTVRSADRSMDDPSSAFNFIGFRCSRSP